MEDKERRAIRRDRNKQHLRPDRDEWDDRPRGENRPRDRDWRRLLDQTEEEDTSGDAPADGSPAVESPADESAAQAEADDQ